MKRYCLLMGLALLLLPVAASANPPIYIAFHWHMHQPIYWPYESLVETASHNPYGFDLTEVHTTRSGPYTAWPMDAVQNGMNAGLGHLGAQVSMSGSLMENLDALDAAGWGFDNWTSDWSTAAGWTTTLGNPRVDLVAFGYHHPLMALIQPGDISLQIDMHRVALQRHFGSSADDSRGIFPPETAFAAWMIPELVDSGIDWVVVDNIHFDRARPEYPYTPGSNLYPPNAADQRNTTGDATFMQLYDLWAPSQVSAPWGYQPHYVAYVDPETGAESRIIAVPAARYEGNEDARGGFGALQYEKVLSQYEDLNTDDDHPMLILLHHDGDNYGGGTDSYYHSNFSNLIAWLQDNPSRFVCTTVQDYLDLFPPDAEDVIYVEPGSWSGADNGDPEFLKWNGNPDDDGYSPDRVSWAVVTAAHNRVATAEANEPISSTAAIVDGTGNHTDRAYHYYLNAQTSCYWYWDFAEGGKWDSHPSRACNLAVAEADQVLTGQFTDNVPPSVYMPQREPYNPGGMEWGATTEPSDFTVWTFVYDVSGLSRVVLRYRNDDDGQVDRDNMLRSSGGWQSIDMTPSAVTAQTNPTPTYIATLYEGEIAGYSQTLIDYQVVAEDTQGNIARSPILHVFVGEQGSAASGVTWTPRSPCREDVITISGPNPGALHWGVNGWITPDTADWPADTIDWGDGEAVETGLVGPNADDRYAIALGPFDETSQVDVIDFVIHNADDTWDNNGGSDYHISIRDSCDPIIPDPTDTAEPAPDTGHTDAGSLPDSGTADAGDVTAPEVDAGADAPLNDGGASADGADSEPSGDGAAGTDDSGCGCLSTESPIRPNPLHAIALAFAFAFIALRRKN